MRYCVIMCGGVGSRFWPLSRSNMPKQFIDFFGCGRTLLQMTYDRILPIVPPERIIVVTNRMYADIVRAQLPDISADNILLEPSRRNTAPCACWAAHHILALDPDASIITLPSDQIVINPDPFRNCMEQAFDFVENSDSLLVVGIKPSYPNTAYGYIQGGKPMESHPEIMKVKSFTEKPDREMARIFMDSGEFFWNSGIFFWTAKSVLNAFSDFDPETAEVFNEGTPFYGTDSEQRFIDNVFANAPSDSIDYAVMEKSPNVFVAVAEFGWSDLGSWKSLYDISPRSKEGNVTQNCRAILHNCEGSIFTAPADKIVVAEGLKDYIVAYNGNALLICPMSEEQNIRTITKEVKSRFGPDFV
ncbi:MAG: mannose-1-phosphate guanylyltransferase [Muribaculum sp.]|nr:mannose-1-phosphate guanylyltransferase [Muribaculum sp.]